MVNFITSIVSTKKLVLAGLFTGISLVVARTWGDVIKSFADKLIINTHCGSWKTPDELNAQIICEDKLRRNNSTSLALAHALATTVIVSVIIWMFIMLGATKS